MTNKNYELKIISREPKSEGKALKKYVIDGQETVGVYEGEPFEIEFKNKTWNKVQVRISIDGTDISTGGLASTKPEGEMWFCEPYGTVKLKAWPESAKGGAEFLFSKSEDSVAANTHENMSGKGIIAAAVFVEGYNPYNSFGIYISGQGGQLAGGYGNLGGFASYNSISHNSGKGLSLGRRSSMISTQSLRSYDAMPVATASASASAGMYNVTQDCCDTDTVDAENLAVGAGDYVEQNIVKVAGLTQPKLDTTISIKYESWTSLRSKVRALQKEVVNVSNPAFPGDAPLAMINLKSTPKGRVKPSRKSSRTPDLQRF